MKSQLSLLFILTVHLCFSQQKDLKVMTWNIWHGGEHGLQSDNFKKNNKHTENTVLVLKEEKPDIIFMQETYCCGMNIAKRAGYEYQSRGSSNLSIHSKYPIIEKINLFKPFNSHAAVIDVEGQHILCVNVWLHYLPANSKKRFEELSSEQLIKEEGKTRFREIKAIIKGINALAQSKKMPIIIGGDFNSASHLDWTNKMSFFHYNKSVEWPVSKFLFDNHFIDSYREVTKNTEQNWIPTIGFFSDRKGERIDYIYYKSKKLKTISSKIVKDDPEGGFFNSDHRAVLTEFQFCN